MEYDRPCVLASQMQQGHQGTILLFEVGHDSQTRPSTPCHAVLHPPVATFEASSAVHVTINTLYAPMRRHPVCFSLLLYYDATSPMLD